MSNSGSRAGAIIVGNVVPQILATAFLGMRAYSRHFLLGVWGADDYLLGFAWICSLITTTLACVQTKYGAGQHQADVDFLEFEEQQKLAFITLPFYTLATNITKLSICLFYLRIFNPQRASRYLIYSCISFLSITMLVFLLVGILQCTPVDAAWNLKKQADGGHCLDTLPAFYASAACNIITEVWLIATVSPRILHLQVKTRQKVALLIVVSLGWLVVVASIIRVVRISNVVHAVDKAYASYDITIWTAVETDVGLICAAAPAIKPFLNRLIPRFMGSLTPNSRSNRYGQRATAYGGGTTRKSFANGFELISSKKVSRSTSQTDLAGSRADRSESKIKGGADNTDVESLGDEIQAGDDGIVKTTSVLVTSMYNGEE